MLSGWVAVLASGIVLFGVARFAYERQGAAAGWLQWAELPAPAQAAALACMLFALELFSRPGASPPFIYFKF